MTLHSSLASARATRARLEELGLSTKKYLGQHFLVDDGVVGKIIRLAALEKGLRVVEVGPGIGTLTEALLAQDVALTSVEVDEALWPGLAEHYPGVELIRGDALAPETLARLHELAPQALVANLPYAVAATLILDYFQKLPSLKSATIMVQREVAERIAAQPHSKAYGSYTVKLRFLAQVKDSFGVSASCFYPPPRVDSTVVRLERQSTVLSDELLATASMLADAAFFQRRKTVRNSLLAYFAAHNLEAGMIDELLASQEVDPQTRGETLAPEVFMALGQTLLAQRG